MKLKRLAAGIAATMALTLGSMSVMAITVPVDGMSCTMTINCSVQVVNASTKTVPANSAYIYVKATAYYENSSGEQIVYRTASNVSYSGEPEVAVSIPRGTNFLSKGDSVHSVNSYTINLSDNAS